MVDPRDHNAAIITEFRANEGRVGGFFEGESLLLLHTVGARSGQERVNPVMYQKTNDGYAIFATYAGKPTNPAWYHNPIANPETTIEVGAETIPVTVRVAESDERERIWSEQTRRVPRFGEYEKSTNRTIPVIVLEPRRR